MNGTDNRELAHKFINYMISPEVMAEAYEATGFGVSVRGAAEHLPDGAIESSVMAEQPGFVDTLSFWAEIPRRGRYLEIWNEVKAAPAE